MIDVKKRALWRDSWQGKLSVWLFEYWQLIVILIALFVDGLVI